MRTIEIEVSEKQEKFLKHFAKKHFDGADDNLYTANAIHVVETYRPNYIPYSDDLTDWFSDLPLQFTTDSSYEVWFDSEVEAVEEWFESRDEESPRDIVAFEELRYETVETKDDEIFVLNFEDYFKAYGIDWYAATWLQDNYEPVAFFFILDEAKRYIEYQRHNLRKPRTYTYSSGYANYGDFDHFRDLLLSIGTKLNQ